MRRLFQTVALAAIAVAGAGLWLTRAQSLPETAFAGVIGNPENGESVFYAGGCASCHSAPGASGDAKLILAGGQTFPSPFGTFVAPNISSDPNQGIGGWTLTEFGTALKHGTSPSGANYYPAFPYTSYTHMTLQDISDLWAFWGTLPASQTASLPHDVGFPFNIRLSLGGWKFLFLNDDWALQDPSSEQLERGRYLVEALGHCAECHTPRNAIGGLDRANWFAGAANPSGQGRIPALTTLEWAESDIAYYLETGFTPDFDSAGGHMAPVVENMAHLPPEDREAIAAYVAAFANN